MACTVKVMVSRDLQNQVKDLHEKGLSVRRIARKTNLSKSTVFRILRDTDREEMEQSQHVFNLICSRPKVSQGLSQTVPKVSQDVPPSVPKVSQDVSQDVSRVSLHPIDNIYACFLMGLLIYGFALGAKELYEEFKEKGLGILD